jgi:hypothetical protein
MPGAFAAFAMARHKANGDRFFSSVLFNDPKTINSPNTVFTGVPVGDAELLPAGRYVPELTFSNFSSKNIHVRTAFAHTSDAIAATEEVNSITVPSHATREIILGDLQGDSALQNSFIVRSDGAPGDLVAKYVSRGDSRLHEVELQAKDEADTDNAGGHPWSIEGNTEFTLLLFNHSSTPQTFTVRVSAEGVDWQKEYKLVSMQNKAISIRDIVDQQIKDDTGKTLPKEAGSGEAGWLVTQSERASGRLLQSDRSIGMARNFSCGYSGLLCGSTVTIYFTTFPDGAVEEFAGIVGETCTSGTPNACSGQRTGTAQFNTSWQSLSTNVASISGSSTSPTVNLQAVAAGTSQVNGEERSSYCQSGGGGPATVQVPTALRVVQTTSNGAATCPAGQSGWERVVMRAVIDQSSADIKVANQSVGETVTLNPGQAGLGSGPIKTGTGTTDANGQYPDTFSICSSSCLSGSANTNTATQTNTDTLPNGGKTYQLTNSTIQYACTYIKINGNLTP